MALREVVGMLVAGMMISSCGDNLTMNETYRALDEIIRIEVEKEGGYPRDITDKVCPIVTAEALNKMKTDPAVTAQIEYRYFEDAPGLVSKVGDEIWWIDSKRKGKQDSSFGKTLMIKINRLSGKCRASVSSNTL